MEGEQRKGKAVIREVKLEEDQKETDGCDYSSQFLKGQGEKDH